MSTVTLQGIADALIGAANPDSQYNMLLGSASIYDDRLYLVRPEQLSPTYEYSPINSVSVKLYGRRVSPAGYGFERAYLRPILESFNAETVTYNTRPNIAPISSATVYDTFYDRGGFYTKQIPGDLKSVMKYGICVDKQEFFENDDDSYVTVDNVSSSYADRRPQIVIDFGDGKNALLPTGTPQSGYVNPQNSIVLKWSTEESSIYGSYTTPEQASAVVSYRETGSENITTIPVTTAQQVTLAANAWDPGTSYEWRVSVTDTGGSTNESPWYTLSTTAGGGLPPKLEFPINAVVDGSQAITFRWTNRGGENNTGTDLEFSTNGEVWGAPINLAGGVDSYTVQPGTIPSGQNYWRARAYNAESEAGDWTNPAFFTVISAPQAPYYEVTNSPRPTISWVSDEQQAFQVQMGDYDSGRVFGTAQSFQCPVYLRNGETTVRVRVMNQYNLWSDWANTSITIENKPGFSTPTLTVEQSQDALLSWEYNNPAILTGPDIEKGGIRSVDGTENASGSRARTKAFLPLPAGTTINVDGYEFGVARYNSASISSYDDYPRQLGSGPYTTDRAAFYRIVYARLDGATIPSSEYPTIAAATSITVQQPVGWLVYRNGTQIAETDGLTYTDRWANGPTTYMVRAILGGDNYVDSNTVEINLETQHPMIAEPGGPWMELRYVTDAVHNTQTTIQQTVTLMQFSGSVYPEAETAPYRQRSRQINVAFLNGQERAFEALLGRECVLRDQYGGVIYGIMSSMNKAQNQFYCVISATIQQLEGEP